MSTGTNEVLVGDDEQIVRGVYEDKWDSVNSRISPSIFQDGGGTSVNRLCIIPLSDQWALMRSEREKVLLRIAEWNVGALQKTARNYAIKTTQLTVVEKPTERNPSHAEIPQKITRGLANDLLKDAVCVLHTEA